MEQMLPLLQVLNTGCLVVEVYYKIEIGLGMTGDLYLGNIRVNHVNHIVNLLSFEIGS